MLQLARWKVILVVLTAILGIVFSAPNLLPASMTEQMPGFLPSKRLNLGLDLQGGSYLKYSVDTASLAREHQANLMEDAQRTLRTEEIEFANAGMIPNGVTLRINDPSKVDAAFRALQSLSTPLTTGRGVTVTVRRAEDQHIQLVRSEEALRQEVRDAVDRSREIIRKRIDPNGTREVQVDREGVDRIVVQVPGERDPEQLKRLIGRTARMTFHLVDVSVSPDQIAAGAPQPPGTTIVPSDDGYSSSYLIRRRALVEGEQLTSAKFGYGDTQQEVVNFSFDSEGTRAFARATRENVGKPFAIVLDGRVISAPNIRSPIEGGRGYIEGNFTPESATELALMLTSGALPAQLIVEQESSVGPEMGAEAIEAGKLATLVAFIGVLVFMVLAYGVLFGGISVVALLVNGLLIIGAMSMTGASLTLPGVAGLILTLAMAVDANVLIYERMRDEVRGGRPTLAAMEAGFARAMVTILDANLTTLIAAWIMFFFGEGPVKGFAWTLSIGVITSVFTAVLFTQVLLAIWYRTVRPKALPIA